MADISDLISREEAAKRLEAIAEKHDRMGMHYDESCFLFAAKVVRGVPAAVKCDTCRKKQYGYLCDGCIHDPSAEDKYEPMTNADRIRAMSDEELKDFLCSIMKCEFCKFEGWGGCELLEWLKQPAEVE